MAMQIQGAQGPLRGRVRLIAGLGNPGVRYAHTYHNAGLLFVDYLRERDKESFSRFKSLSYFSYAKGPRYTLLKPKGFMNTSGNGILRALRFFKFSPESLLVVHDESDLDLGKFKLSFDRGAAGHKGAASVIESLGTAKFWRVRIGIRHGKGKAEEFVLRPMSAEHKKTLYGVFDEAIENVIENVSA